MLLVYQTKLTLSYNDSLLFQIFVYGVLEFSTEKDTILGANRIIVVGGKIVLGWKDEPLKVKALIRLTGNRDDKEYTMNDGTLVGSKVRIIQIKISRRQ